MVTLAKARQHQEPLSDATDMTAAVLPHDAIARRADQLCEERGRGDGRDWDDWFQAERELRRVTGAADVAA